MVKTYQIRIALVILGVLISTSFITTPLLSTSAFALKKDPKFKVKVLNVFTRDLKVDITLKEIHKSAIVHHGTSHTDGVTRQLTIDFGAVSGVDIGTNYEICLSVVHRPSAFCEENQITSLPIQKVTLDTNDLED
jgi:hypothetical protein